MSCCAAQIDTLRIRDEQLQGWLKQITDLDQFETGTFTFLADAGEPGADIILAPVIGGHVGAEDRDLSERSGRQAE